MVLTEATGDAELMLWDGRELGHFYVAKSSKRRVHASVKLWPLSTVCIIKFAKFVPSTFKK
jgi:hypothetical protein